MKLRAACVAAVFLSLLSFPAAQTPGSSPTPASGTQAATPQAPKTQSLKDLFLAQTKVQQESPGAAKNIFRYSFLFPIKATAELTITLQPNQFYTPTAQEAKAVGTGPKFYGLKTTNDVNANSTTLSYFVPYNSLSPSVVQQLRGMATGPAARIRPRYAPRLRTVAFQGAGTQTGNGSQQQPESLPVPLGNGQGQGEEGVSVSAALSWQTALEDVAKVIEALEQWAKGVGMEIPGLSPVGTGASSAANTIEAFELNDTDTNLLTQMLGWQKCAHNLSSLGLTDYYNRGQGGSPPYIDDQVSNFYADMIGQFIALLIKEIPVVGSILNANEQIKALSEPLDQYLSNVRGVLPQCKGMWYGHFHAIATVTGATSDITGTIVFDASSGPVKGEIQEHDKFTSVGYLTCSGEGDFSADLFGTVVKAPQLSDPSSKGPSIPDRAGLDIGALTPTGQSVECKVLDGSTLAITQSPPSWNLVANLVSGQPTDYDLPYVPTVSTAAAPPEVPGAFVAAAAAAGTFQQVGETGHVTVTVVQLQ
jgi:hypothetical protein